MEQYVCSWIKSFSTILPLEIVCKTTIYVGVQEIKFFILYDQTVQKELFDIENLLPIFTCTSKILQIPVLYLVFWVYLKIHFLENNYVFPVYRKVEKYSKSPFRRLVSNKCKSLFYVKWHHKRTLFLTNLPRIVNISVFDVEEPAPLVVFKKRRSEVTIGEMCAIRKPSVFLTNFIGRYHYLISSSYPILSNDGFSHSIFFLLLYLNILKLKYSKFTSDLLPVLEYFYLHLLKLDRSLISNNTHSLLTLHLLL